MYILRFRMNNRSVLIVWGNSGSLSSDILRVWVLTLHSISAAALWMTWHCIQQMRIHQKVGYTQEGGGAEHMVYLNGDWLEITTGFYSANHGLDRGRVARFSVLQFRFCNNNFFCERIFQCRYITFAVDFNASTNISFSLGLWLVLPPSLAPMPEREVHPTNTGKNQR